MKHYKLILAYIFLWNTSTILGESPWINNNHPHRHFSINQIEPENASPGQTVNCDEYRKLQRYPIHIMVPNQTIHPAAPYDVLINAQRVKMFTDNGWGPPSYLYAPNVVINNTTLQQFFIIFTNNQYQQISNLVMRGFPNSRYKGDCRIIAIPS